MNNKKITATIETDNFSNNINISYEFNGDIDKLLNDSLQENLSNEEIAKRIEYAYEHLSITNDFIFSKVMQNNELCKELLQIIFPDLNIISITYQNIQQVFDINIDTKGVRLDVYVEDNNGNIYDIEMQLLIHKNIPKRTRFYQSIIDMQTLCKGEDYSKLKPSYIIFICPFDLFGKGRRIYTFKNICEEDRRIFLGDETSKIFLNASGSIGKASEKLQAFLDYVAGIKTNDTFVDKLNRAVKEASHNKDWRAEFMMYSLHEMDRINQGIEIGIERGLEQGKIFAYYDMNLSVSEISKKMNISEDKIWNVINSEINKK